MFDGIIDINHKDDVDFAKAKAEGVAAVIHKATEGGTFKDPEYAKRRARADTLGLLWGAYHFGTNAPVSEQLDNFAHVAAPLRPGDFVSLDYETRKLKDGSDITMSLAQAEDFVQQFKTRFGFTPAIYGSDLLTAAAKQHPASPLKDCKLWIAQYTTKPQPSLPKLWTKFTLWQFTDGTDGDEPHKTAGKPCDRNRFDGTVDELRAAWPLR